MPGAGRKGRRKAREAMQGDDPAEPQPDAGILTVSQKGKPRDFGSVQYPFRDLMAH